MVKSSISRTRTERAERKAVRFEDDIVLEWCGPTCLCRISGAFDYREADARLVLRRGPDEMVLVPGLGNAMGVTHDHHLQEGDEVAIQWRVWTPGRVATSDTAELELSRVEDE